MPQAAAGLQWHLLVASLIVLLVHDQQPWAKAMRVLHAFSLFFAWHVIALAPF